MRHIFSSLAMAALATIASPAGAADAVTDAMQAAYPAYRAALFRTNSKAQPESQQAIAQAQQAWKALSERFGAKPPSPYDRDAGFGATLAKVSAVYEKAAGEISDNKLPEAHETLESARDLMAELRRRNGVIVFSDHMNAYHAEMEHLLIDGPKMLAEPQWPQLVMAQVGALEYLARQLREQAPASQAANPEFDTMLKEVEVSVRGVKTALLAQDAAAVRAALGKVKPPYSKLFLKFG
jgi:hypothetical protein